MLLHYLVNSKTRKRQKLHIFAYYYCSAFCKQACKAHHLLSKCLLFNVWLYVPVGTNRKGTLHSILQNVTNMFEVYRICCSVSRCVINRSCPSLSPELKPVDRVLLGYCTIWTIWNTVKYIIDGNFVFQQYGALCILHSTLCLSVAVICSEKQLPFS